MREMTRNRSRSKGFPVMIGCFLAIVVIMIWEAASSHARYTWTSETDSVSGEVQKIRIRDGRWRLAVDYRGDVVLTASEDGIESLGPGAFLEIEERRRGQRRRLEATPGPDGRPEIAWWVDGDRAEPDKATRSWLAGVLPRIHRSTGIGAEGRVERILAASGVAGVLLEIDKIGGDRVQRIYFEELLRQAEPTGTELERVLRRMAREIGSDHEMRRLVEKIPAEALTAEAIGNAYLAVARTIGSDHELGRVLTPLITTPAFPDVCPTILDAAVGIGNDFELAKLLITIAGAYPEDRPLPPGFVRALRTLGNDHEERKVLDATLRRPGLDADVLDVLLHTAENIGSDFELAALMVELSRSHGGDLPEAYFRALRTIGSDYELRRVLSAVASRSELSGENLESTLESALGIGSDHELAQFLRQLVEAHPIVEQARPAFDRALASIGSEHERQRVEAVLSSSESS